MDNAPRGLDGLLAAFGPDSARFLINNSTEGMSEAMRVATSLGHLVLDTPMDREFGIASSPWTHWPCVARAKAFGAMLLMPEDSVRELVQRHGTVDIGLVRKMMATFGTGPMATTWHLLNLRLLSREHRDEILVKLGASQGSDG